MLNNIDLPDITRCGKIIINPSYDFGYVFEEQYEKIYKKIYNRQFHKGLLYIGLLIILIGVLMFAIPYYMISKDINPTLVMLASTYTSFQIIRFIPFMWQPFYEYKEIGYMKQLANKINNFDNYYEMSDDPRIYDKGEKDKKLIKKEISLLNQEQIKELESYLNSKGRRVWDRYF